MGRFRLAVYAPIAIAVFWFLMSGTNKDSAVPDELANVQAQPQSILLPKATTISPLKPSSGVITINVPNDFRLLSVGQKFSIRTSTQNTQALVVLDVISTSESSNYILITASSSPGSTSVIVLTESLTNILIKTAINVFEYSGADFKGVVDQVTDLNLDDDIHYDEPKKLMPIESVLPEELME